VGGGGALIYRILNTDFYVHKNGCMILWESISAGEWRLLWKSIFEFQMHVRIAVIRRTVRIRATLPPTGIHHSCGVAGGARMVTMLTWSVLSRS